MRSSRYVYLAAVLIVLFVGACGKESGDGLLAVDTVPPLPPVNVSVEIQDDLVAITWDANAETDLEGYRLYKSSSSSGSYEAVTPNVLYCPWYYDEDISYVTTYYRVTAVDRSGNESAFSQIVALYFHRHGKDHHIKYPDVLSK